jgi:hypothetical protein
VRDTPTHEPGDAEHRSVNGEYKPVVGVWHPAALIAPCAVRGTDHVGKIPFRSLFCHDKPAHDALEQDRRCGELLDRGDAASMVTGRMFLVKDILEGITLPFLILWMLITARSL